MKIPNSKRLSYQLIDKSDAQFMFELDQDPEVMKYINGGEPNSMSEIIDVLIPRMESYRNPNQGWGIWKTTELSSGKDIGSLIARPMHFFSDTTEFDNIELGWRFYRETWGKGYATEAANQLKEAFKEDDSVNKVSAIAHKENIASTQIMKKLGMKYIKTYRHIDPLFDEIVVYYELEF